LHRRLAPLASLVAASSTRPRSRASATDDLLRALGHEKSEVFPEDFFLRLVPASAAVEPVLAGP
jgi:hypothetical protein